MPRIDGSFTGVTTAQARPYIDWSYTQDIVNNFSDVTVSLYFQKVNASYTGYNLTGSAKGNINVNNDYSQSNITFDLRSQSLQLVRQRVVRVYHNADGSKACLINSDGKTDIYWGDFNFGAVVTLNTIPREAYLTVTPNFTIGDTINLTLNNGGNLFVQSTLYVNGVQIAVNRHGQVSSASIVPDASQIAAMYAQTPNSTQVGAVVRITTWTDAGYGTQVGGVRDTACTAYVNQTTNKPTFTTYTIANVDKSIAVVDKYNNTLITSSTQTLTGSSSKIIKGYSKVRATITAANKMVALNSATAIKYRLVVGPKVNEADYSAGSTVTIDIDNVDVVDNSVTAYDSRNLTTTVALTGAFPIIANYTPVNLYGLKLTRANGVDASTTLEFGGTYWKKYFSSDSNVNPGSGVLNTVVVAYRYKESTDTWASQTWTTLSPTIDADGNISYSATVDGDLGGSGFTTTKAFDIELRAYDKLSQIIIDAVLSTGTPVMHMTKNAVAVGRKAGSGDTSKFQVNGAVSIDEISATPSDPSQDNQAKFYVKANKFVIVWNDGGTIRYKYLDLTGTGVTWTHSTSAP